MIGKEKKGLRYGGYTISKFFFYNDLNLFLHIFEELIERSFQLLGAAIIGVQKPLRWMNGSTTWGQELLHELETASCKRARYLYASPVISRLPE
jgi:hypothetical protein